MCRQRPGSFHGPLIGRNRLPGNMAVHPFHRIGSGEGQRPRQHLVEGDAKRVEIAARIDRAVHPSGLLRRHVGEGAGDLVGRLGVGALARQAGGNAEAGEPDTAARHIHQDVRRLDVLMDESARMHLAQRPRERNRDAQKLRYSQWLAEQSIEDRTPGVLEHQRQAVAVAGKFDWLRRPGGIKVGPERVFVFESLEARERGILRRDQQDRRQSLAATPIQRQVAVAQR